MTCLSPETASRILMFNMNRAAPPRRAKRFRLPELVAGVVLVGMIVGAFL